VIVGRLLLVAQGFVNRKLEDEVGLRMAAVREGCTYLQARMRLLEFPRRRRRLAHAARL